MNAKKLTLTSLNAAMLLALAPTTVLADSILDAIASGKTTLEMRARAEWVDDSIATKKADAETLRTVLGYRTSPYNFLGDNYLSGYLEFENVTNFGREHYNTGAVGLPNKRTQFATIVDPEVTQVNQVYLEAFGAKVGRQKVILDNARFFGDVGWRQNDQVFDAVAYQNKMIPGTTITVDYLTKANMASGLRKPIDAPLVNLKYSGFMGHNQTVFYYAVEEQNTPAASFQDVGLRLDGAFGGFLYDLSFAQQSDYKDGTVPDADYMDVQLGYKFGPVFTIKAQHEVLEKGFNTPYATLHAFNGWADMFLTTPADGLEDNNIKLLAKYWDINFVLALHDFQADSKSQDFGQEVDFSVGKKFSPNFSGLIKAASYMADDKAPGALSKDRNKIWLQLSYTM